MKSTFLHMFSCGTREFRQRPHSVEDQRGAALIVGLIFLVILTLLGVTAMQSSTLEERMAGNARDRNLAFQAAEAALRDAERDIRGKQRPAMHRPSCAGSVVILGMTGTDAACTEGLCCVIGASGLTCAERETPVDRDDTLSLSDAPSVEYGHYTAAPALTGVAAQPRYLIEPFTKGQPKINYYRITARGYGAKASTQVTLQESTSTRSKTMKRARKCSIAGFLLAALGGIASFSHAAMSIPSGPLYVGAAVPPTVMLDITKDQNLYKKAYNDYSDLDGDGVVDTTYKHPIDYYGYFDSYKCYNYNTATARFEPIASSYAEAAGVPIKPSDCSGNWHGNFLNWVSMSRMDAVRKLLYGGYRSTDGAGAAGITVLERAFITTDAHAWAKYYNPDVAKAFDQTSTDAAVLSGRYPAINKLTPFSPTTTPTAVASSTSNTIGTGADDFCRT